MSAPFRFPESRDPSQPCGYCAQCQDAERLRAFVLELRRDAAGVEVFGPGHECRRVVAWRLAQAQRDGRS